MVELGALPKNNSAPVKVNNSLASKKSNASGGNAKGGGGNPNRIHPISEAYQRSRRGTLQDKKWEDLETDEISEQVVKQPLLFRDFLPRGMSTKKDAVKLSAKSASPAPSPTPLGSKSSAG